MKVSDLHEAACVACAALFVQRIHLRVFVDSWTDDSSAKYAPDSSDPDAGTITARLAECLRPLRLRLNGVGLARTKWGW